MLPSPAGPKGCPRGRAAVRGRAGKWEDKQVRSNEAGAQEPMVGGRRQEEAGLHREVAPSPWEMLLPT